MLDKVIDTKIFIGTGKKLADKVTLKNLIISISCVIKNFDKIIRKYIVRRSISSIKLIKVGKKLVTAV